jgi:hypothetical protein
MVLINHLPGLNIASSIAMSYLTSFTVITNVN